LFIPAVSIWGKMRGCRDAGVATGKSPSKSAVVTQVLITVANPNADTNPTGL